MNPRKIATLTLTLVALLAIAPAVLAFEAIVPLQEHEAAAPAQNDAGQELGQLLSDAKQIEQLESERRDAARDLNRQLNTNRRMVQELEKEGGLPQTEIDQTQEQIKRYEEQVQQTQDRIAELKSKLELANMATPDKKAKAEELRGQSDALQSKIQEAQKPAEEKLKAFRNEIKGRGQALEAIIKPAFRDGTGDFEGVKLSGYKFTYDQAFINLCWNKGDHQFAWAHVRIRPGAEQEYEEKLAGKYPLQSMSDNSMWVWDGHFLITFVASESSMPSRDLLEAGALNLIDMEALAGIKAVSVEAPAKTE